MDTDIATMSDPWQARRRFAHRARTGRVPFED